jgi:hypothetical protein
MSVCTPSASAANATPTEDVACVRTIFYASVLPAEATQEERDAQERTIVVAFAAVRNVPFVARELVFRGRAQLLAAYVRCVHLPTFPADGTLFSAEAVVRALLFGVDLLVGPAVRFLRAMDVGVLSSRAFKEFVRRGVELLDEQADARDLLDALVCVRGLHRPSAFGVDASRVPAHTQAILDRVFLEHVLRHCSDADAGPLALDAPLGAGVQVVRSPFAAESDADNEAGPISVDMSVAFERAWCHVVGARTGTAANMRLLTFDGGERAIVRALAASGRVNAVVRLVYCANAPLDAVVAVGVLLEDGHAVAAQAVMQHLRLAVAVHPADSRVEVPAVSSDTRSRLVQLYTRVAGSPARPEGPLVSAAVHRKRSRACADLDADGRQWVM